MIIELLLGVIFTFLLYSAPILFYRYFIVNEPIERKKAKIIVICYAIVSFIIMFFILLLIGDSLPKGVPTVFYAFLNYKLITKGIDDIETDKELEERLRNKYESFDEMVSYVMPYLICDDELKKGSLNENYAQTIKQSWDKKIIEVKGSDYKYEIQKLYMYLTANGYDKQLKLIERHNNGEFLLDKGEVGTLTLNTNDFSDDLEENKSVTESEQSGATIIEEKMEPTLQIQTVNTGNENNKNLEIKFCPYCGTKLIDGAEFCHKCGKSKLH